MGLTLEMMAAMDKTLLDGIGEFILGGMHNGFFEKKRGMVQPPQLFREDIVNYILSNSGHFPTIHSNCDDFKRHFTIWWNANISRWYNLYETLFFDYDPISNYDRTEKWEETGKANSAENGAHTSKGSSKDSATRTDSVSAFDSSTQTERAKQTETGSVENSANGNSQRTNNASHSNTKTGRAYGNIGVTTTQEMLESERKLLDYSILSIINAEYKERFCILIY